MTTHNSSGSLFDRVRFSEAAVAVRREAGSNGNPAVIYEGSLHDTVLWYAGLNNSERRGVLIHLPDRRSKPFTYNDAEMKLLAIQLKPQW